MAQSRKDPHHARVQRIGVTMKVYPVKAAKHPSLAMRAAYNLFTVAGDTKARGKLVERYKNYHRALRTDPLKAHLKLSGGSMRGRMVEAFYQRFGQLMETLDSFADTMQTEKGWTYGTKRDWQARNLRAERKKLHGHDRRELTARWKSAKRFGMGVLKTAVFGTVANKGRADKNVQVEPSSYSSKLMNVLKGAGARFKYSGPITPMAKPVARNMWAPNKIGGFSMRSGGLEWLRHSAGWLWGKLMEGRRQCINPRE